MTQRNATPPDNGRGESVRWFESASGASPNATMNIRVALALQPRMLNKCAILQ